MGHAEGFILDEHPDLALLSHQARRGICCLALCGASQAQLDALTALGAFALYHL